MYCWKMTAISYGTVKEITIFGTAPLSDSSFPVDSVIKSRHVANAIMKQAKVKYHF
jgi:hypothetical protein